MEVVDIESYLKSTANWGGRADFELLAADYLPADMVLSDWLASPPHKPKEEPAPKPELELDDEALEPEDLEELALQEHGVELMESDKHGRDDEMDDVANLEEVGDRLDSLEPAEPVPTPAFKAKNKFQDLDELFRRARELK